MVQAVGQAAHRDDGRLSLLISTAGGWLLALVWMVALTPSIFASLSASGNDDAMRLVQVRDLLQGQPWFDLTQHRLGPAEGTPMHWSRLVDLPIAVLILLSRPLVGAAAAEAVAATLWPLLLIGPLVLGLAASARALGQRGADFAAALLAAGLAFTSFKFQPGALDHHNLQLVLLASSLAGVVLSRRRPGFGLLAGASLAASLATGIEMLVQSAAIAAGMACLWAWEGAAARRATLAFAAALALALPLLFLATAPAEAWSFAFCDALTLPLLLPATLGAAGLWLVAATLSARPRRLRLLGLAALAALVGATALAASPACLADPFAGIDPRLMQHWIAQVNEARPIGAVLSDNPIAHLGSYAVPLLGLGAAVVFALRAAPADRGLWVLLAVLLLLCAALAAYQVRTRAALEVVAILPLACLIAQPYARWRQTRARRDGLAALTLLLLSLPMAWTLVLGSLFKGVEPRSSGTAAGLVHCLAPAYFAPLAALPPGRVAASSNLGAHILRFTDHRVLAAPYHRNQAGLLTQLEIALAPPPEAEERLRAAAVDYLAFCLADPEYAGAGAPETRFFFALQAGGDFVFLEPMETPPDSPLRLFRFRAP